MPVSVTFQVLATLLKSENSSPRFLAFFKDQLTFFLVIPVTLTYVHAHTYRCADIFSKA